MQCNHDMDKLVYKNGDLCCISCKKSWFEIVLKNTDCFDEGITEKYNSIIAYEYYKLGELIRKKQIYGCLFQIKDFYEILLKIPVLITASMVYRKDTNTDLESRLLITLIQKKHSLGDWRQYLNLSKKIVRSSDYYPDLLNKIIRSTFKFSNADSGINGIDIINWRNKVIGHGALVLDSDMNLYEDLEVRISELTTFLNNNFEIYNQLTFIIPNKENYIYI